MNKVFFVIVGLLMGYSILCFMGPSVASVERSIVINTSAGELQHQLADLKFFVESWSPWTDKDPNMKTTYAGECCEPGSSMSWESDVKEVGKGKMTFERFSGDSVIETLNFDGMGDSKVYFISKAQGQEAKVTWAMQTDVSFFGRGIFLFMNMDKMIGPDFENGLFKLKKAIESKPAAISTEEIKEVN